MDGTVIGHTPGKGKYAGLMGSLQLKLKNDVTFNLGTGFSMNERHYAPRIGGCGHVQTLRILQKRQAPVCLVCKD